MSKRTKKIEELHIVRVRSSLTYMESPPTRGRVESNYSPSEAVPDQSLTVRELLRRHTSGTLPDIAQGEPFYNEDMPDMRGMDIVEKRRLLEENKTFIEETYKSQKTKNEEKKSAADAAKLASPPAEPVPPSEIPPKT